MREREISISYEKSQNEAGTTYAYFILHLRRDGITPLSKFYIGDSVNVTTDGNILRVSVPKYDKTDTKVSKRNQGKNNAPRAAIRVGSITQSAVFNTLCDVLDIDSQYASQTTRSVKAVSNGDTPGFYIDLSTLKSTANTGVVGVQTPTASENEQITSLLKELEYARRLATEWADSVWELRSVVAYQASVIKSLKRTVVCATDVSKNVGNIASAIDILKGELSMDMFESMVDFSNVPEVSMDTIALRIKDAIAIGGRDHVVSLISSYGASKASGIKDHMRPLFYAELLALKLSV